MQKCFLKTIETIAIFTAAFLIFCFPKTCCHAFDSTEPNLLQNQFDESEANKLNFAIDEDTKKNMEQIGIGSPQVSQMQNFSIQNFFKFLFSQAIKTLKQPVFIFANCLAIILIAALFENFKPQLNGNDLNPILGLVTTLCTCAIIITPIIKCIMGVSKTIKNFENFMICFIPVFAGTLAMNFKTATSIGYSSTLFFVAQFVSAIISNLLLPITGAFLAFSIIGNTSGDLKLSALTSTAKKIVIFVLMFMVTIFIGLFSLQTSIAVSSDGLTMKTAKFVSSSFIPIIGKALGEALGSVIGGLNLIKSAVGGFGILVCLASFIPPILNISFFLAVVSITGAIAKSFKIDLIGQTMDSTKDCLSILLSFLICYSILVISTTSIIINLT